MPDPVELNPFAPDQAPGMQLVVLMRIYDALMAILQATDSELHDKLDAVHESGDVAWSLPYLNLSGKSENTTDPDALDKDASLIEDDPSLPPVES